MIASLSEVLGEPGSGQPVGAFTAYDLETGGRRAARRRTRERPVILLVSRASFAEPAGRRLGPRRCSRQRPTRAGAAPASSSTTSPISR